MFQGFIDLSLSYDGGVEIDFLCLKSQGHLVYSSQTTQLKHNWGQVSRTCPMLKEAIRMDKGAKEESSRTHSSHHPISPLYNSIQTLLPNRKKALSILIQIYEGLGGLSLY